MNMTVGRGNQAPCSTAASSASADTLVRGSLSKDAQMLSHLLSDDTMSVHSDDFSIQSTPSDAPPSSPAQPKRESSLPTRLIHRVFAPRRRPSKTTNGNSGNTNRPQLECRQDKSTNVFRLSAWTDLDGEDAGCSSNTSFASIKAAKEVKCATIFHDGRERLHVQQDKKAMHLFRRALLLKKEICGDDDRQSLALMLVTIADLLREKRGQSRKALKFYQAAYEIVVEEEETAYVSSLEFRTMLLHMGDIYCDRAEIEKAMKCYRESMYHHAAASDKAMLLNADALVGIGRVRCEQCCYNKAMEHFQSALPVQQNTLGLHHPKVATTLHYIGVALARQGKQEEALTHYRQAFTIRQTTMPKSHSHIAQSLNSMGVVFANDGKFSEAMQVFQNALKILCANYGRKHAAVARTLNNLGIAYSARAQHRHALKLYEEAKTITEESFRKSHPFVGDLLVNMGNSYAHDVEDTSSDKAFECYTEALRIYRLNNFPEDHPSVAHAVAILTKFQYVEDRAC